MAASLRCVSSLASVVHVHGAMRSRTALHAVSSAESIGFMFAGLVRARSFASVWSASAASRTAGTFLRALGKPAVGHALISRRATASPPVASRRGGRL